jgi:glycosyltransferase involved in cell wall biosynthesis
MRKVIEEDRLCPVAKLRALPAWNYNGLRAMAARRHQRDEYRFTVRQHLSIPASAFIVGFVGRLVPEKGISELLQAHARIVTRFPCSHLLLIGYTEEEQPLPASVLAMLRQTPNVHQIGFQSDVVPYLASIDVLTLPSYREGLPTAPLEAATLGVPVILSDIPGCIDAATANVTGIFVPARDANALANAMERLLTDPQKRSRLGDAATRWADKLIQHRTWESLLRDYDDLSGRPVLSPQAEAH